VIDTEGAPVAHGDFGVIGLAAAHADQALLDVSFAVLGTGAGGNARFEYR
jgi:hypothetical protein